MIETLSVAAIYAATLVAIGAATVGWLRGAFDRTHAPALSRAGALAVVALPLLLFARLGLHTADVFGPASIFSLESLTTIGVRSRWGEGWRLQVAAAAALTACWIWYRRQPSRGLLFVASAAAAFLALTMPRLGHSAGDWPRSLIAGAHVIAGGAWLGALLVIVIDASPGLVRQTSHADALPTPAAGIYARFSPVAMWAVPLVALTGGTLAWMYLGSLGNFTATSYGRLLVTKLAIFAAIGACGFLNWRRVRVDEAPRMVYAEAILAIVLIVVTAFLTETAHP